MTFGYKPCHAWEAELINFVYTYCMLESFRITLMHIILPLASS